MNCKINLKRHFGRVKRRKYKSRHVSRSIRLSRRKRCLAINKLASKISKRDCIDYKRALSLAHGKVMFK